MGEVNDNLIRWFNEHNVDVDTTGCKKVSIKIKKLLKMDDAS